MRADCSPCSDSSMTVSSLEVLEVCQELERRCRWRCGRPWGWGPAWTATATQLASCPSAGSPPPPRSDRGAGAASHHRVRKTSRHATLMITFPPPTSGAHVLQREHGLRAETNGRWPRMINCCARCATERARAASRDEWAVAQNEELLGGGPQIDQGAVLPSGPRSGTIAWVAHDRL